MTEYQISFVADVDGDGSMEVMILSLWLDALPAEGFSLIDEKLLKVRGNKIETLADVDSHPV